MTYLLSLFVGVPVFRDAVGVALVGVLFLVGLYMGRAR